MLYQLYANTMAMLQPVNYAAYSARQMLDQPFSYTYSGRMVNAYLEFIERTTANYVKPEFDLLTTNINNRKVAVSEEVVAIKPFCNLLHFKRQTTKQDLKVLMIAPLSGHFATLLRGTVEHFLPDHDVYITDWRNARNISTSKGNFHFDDYVDYLIDFIKFLGPNTHVIAVCQPAVPALVATTVLAMANDLCLPSSLTLMGGPIDTSKNPTEVNDYAAIRDLDWFKNHVIHEVPLGYRGHGRKVYPGFIQLTGFITMNAGDHLSKHFKFFWDLVEGDGDSFEAHRKFYNEYLAVMDIPAQFYLETIQKVFLEKHLPNRCMQYKGELIDTNAIKNMGLLTIEGEHDDITGHGQTKAAHELCENIPANRQQHYLQTDVGHYGIFNGRRFREHIGPVIKQFIQQQQKFIKT